MTKNNKPQPRHVKTGQDDRTRIDYQGPTSIMFARTINRLLANNDTFDTGNKDKNR